MKQKKKKGKRASLLNYEPLPRSAFLTIPNLVPKNSLIVKWDTSVSVATSARDKSRPRIYGVIRGMKIIASRNTPRRVGPVTICFLQHT